MKKILLFLVILFFTTDSFALAETPQGNSNTDKAITEQDLNTLKEEYYKEKIGLLQGNISNLIGFFSAVIAIFAIGLTIFGVILNRKFTQKYEEMLQLNNTFQTFDNNARTRAQEVQKTEQKIIQINEDIRTTKDILNEKIINLSDRQQLINSIPHSLQVSEINNSKNLHYNKFVFLNFKCENMIKEIQFTFDNYDFTKYEEFNESSRQVFREVATSEDTSNQNAGNYTKADELQKFVDIQDGLKRSEGELLEYVNEPLTIEKFDEDTFDESPDFFNEWESYFKDLELMYADIQQSISNKLINKIEK